MPEQITARWQWLIWSQCCQARFGDVSTIALITNPAVGSAGAHVIPEGAAVARKCGANADLATGQARALGQRNENAAKTSAADLGSNCLPCN